MKTIQDITQRFDSGACARVGGGEMTVGRDMIVGSVRRTSAVLG